MSYTRPSRETVMATLFNALTRAVVTNFTADTANGSQTLSNPSTSTNLFLGLPVFGAGIPRGAVITALSPLTISLAATANGTAVSMTTGFLTTGRRARFMKDTPLPALYLEDTAENLEYQGMQQVQTIKAELAIGANAGENPDVVPLTALNNLLDAIQAALAPDDIESGRFTLGGLVFWCRMVGKVEKDPGDIGPLAVAVADIEIIVP